MGRYSLFFRNYIGFYIIVVLYKSRDVECRVFCQDLNSRPWAPLGYTCPVLCASVLDAIDKLIMLDYKRAVKEQLGGRQNQNTRHIAFENDDTMNYYPYLREKISKSNNDQEFTSYDNKIDRTKYIGDNKKSQNNNAVYNEYKVEGFDDFDANETEVKDFAKKIKYSKSEYNNVEFVGYSESAKQNMVNIKKSDRSKHYKQKITDISEHNKNLHEINDKIKFKHKHHDINFKSYNGKIDIEHLKILESIKNAKGILRRSYTNSQAMVNSTKYEINNKINTKYDSDRVDKEKNKCWYLEKFKPKLLLGKVVRRKCGRRSNFDAKFVTVMTNVLNKYVDTAFRFTEEMTEILLENIFGKSTDLRNNIFDVDKLLNYLRKSVDRHKVHSHRHVITLKSKHCLTVAMPGCFCKSGFVESSGQCVKPEDCVTDENYLQYLTRIVVV